MVAPITFGDGVVKKPDTPIFPSQLHPFLDADVVARRGMFSAGERSRLFLNSFLNAVYARYLLAYWVDSSSPWVSRVKVFDGAASPDHAHLLEAYEVNIAGVVRTTNAVVENAATPRNGGASLHCRVREKQLSSLVRMTLVAALNLQLWGRDVLVFAFVFLAEHYVEAFRTLFPMLGGRGWHADCCTWTAFWRLKDTMATMNVLSRNFASM
ncbi:Bodo-specific multi-copy gene family, putative [Bodo saltans]|uniref:Bodo-specific multi-copy gene family, putative n=1 Tax=Bodo saltans TaxID=75058 RepID=A0A0S4K0X5_BODSA|nr:Bodo-specific multi-copy gene family, putative [Bodo saltans]|eukprot:CUG94476.1 Bodo-specific multi-copy gene family, putative [Bodo saltans]